MADDDSRAVAIATRIRVPSSSHQWLADAVPLPALVHDASFRATAANGLLCGLLGGDGGELLRRADTTLFPPADRQAIVDWYSALRGSGGERIVAERHWVAADGRTVWSRTVSRAVQLDGQRVYLHVLQDAADAGGRVGAEPRSDARADPQSDARSDARADPRSARLPASPGGRTLDRSDVFDAVRNHFEVAPIAAVVHDAGYRVSLANRAFAKTFGLPLDPAERLRTTPQGWRFMPDGALALGPEVPHGEVLRQRMAMRGAAASEIWADCLTTRFTAIDGQELWVTVLSDVTAEHLLSEELKRLVLQQAALLRSTAAGVAHVAAGAIVRVNASLEAILGRDAAELQGKAVSEVFGSATWDVISEQAAPVLAQGGTWRQELSLQRRGQPSLTCEAGIRLVDPADPGSGMMITLVDVTGYKAQQAELRRRNAELEALIDNEAAAIAYLENGRVVRCNRVLETMLRQPAGALIGQRLAPYLQCDDPALIEALSGGRERQRSATAKADLVRPAGTPLHCVVHVRAVEASRAPAAAVFVGIDLSDQQAAEVQLAEVQERFQRFAEVVDEVMMVVDASFVRPLYCNGRLQSVFGTTLDEFYRNPVSAFTHVDPADRARIFDAAARARGSPQHELEVQVTARNGARRLVRVRLCAAVSDLDEVYVTAEDITDYRRLERQRLEDALAQRDALVREIHHRIKNNLQGVAGLLQQNARGRPELAAALDEVAGRILAIAQVHGLQMRDSSDLMPLRLVETMMQHLSRSHGVPVLVDAAGRAAFEPWGVPEQESVPLALAINEVATNAIRHRTGGNVTVRVSADDDGVLLVWSNEGQLPAAFDFDRMPTAPSGLGLLKAMLPRRGARATFEQVGRRVEVSLHLTPPALHRRDNGSVS